ncbi:transposase [Streptomyces sp. NPDC048473]|uniref:transposase n=1 Tax=Streptomyces sp. NPDC048473 TaxID=3365556 RepID=UPI0037126F09
MAATNNSTPGPASSARSSPSAWRAPAPTAPKLASHLRRHGHKLVEVNRPDRRVRRQRGKSDPIDAENAARAVLAGTATAAPKSGEGTVEMIRHLKIARDGAVKARTQAMVTLKALIVTVPDELRQQLQGLPKMTLIERCAGLRPGPVTSPAASAKHSIRAMARRWKDLHDEVKEHDVLLGQLTKGHAPDLVDAFGIGADTAAEVLVTVGDNPERIRSQAAFAKLAGVCPVPASSGKTASSIDPPSGASRRRRWAGFSELHFTQRPLTRPPWPFTSVTNSGSPHRFGGRQAEPSQAGIRSKAR